MTEWWTSLDLFMKILWCIAIASSLIFIIETVLTFIGADVEMDMDTDFDIADGGFEGDPSMNLYTFRNLVNFLLGMSWTAILLNEQMKSKALLMLIAFAVGAAIVFAYTTASAAIWAIRHNHKTQAWIGFIGCIISLFFLSLLIIPGMPGYLSIQSRIILLVWIVIGAVFYALIYEKYKKRSDENKVEEVEK